MNSGAADRAAGFAIATCADSSGSDVAVNRVVPAGKPFIFRM
jgi:hypothetical protein